jgi:peroxiredoxin
MSTYLRISTITPALALLVTLSATSFAGDTVTASQSAGSPQTASDAAADNAKSEIAATEKSIRDMFGMDKIKDITYRDEKGGSLTSDEFFGRVGAGSSFGMKHPPGNKTSAAVLYLTVKNEADKPRVATYKIKPGDSFPRFRATLLDGTALDAKQLLGRYSLVNFYFAQCGPCVKEVPDLNALALAHQDMRFLAFTSDQKSDAKQFIADTKFAWTIAPDSSNLINKIGVKAYPAFALLDSRGKVISIATRSEIASSDQSVENWVNRLTAGTTSQ